MSLAANSHIQPALAGTSIGDFQDLRVTRDPAHPMVAWVVLDRAEARNAYSEAMVPSLIAAFDALEADASVRAVILAGAGRSFSAGGDLKAMRDHSGMFEGDAVELRSRYLRGIQSIPRRLARFDKPIVAIVHGAAIGAGLDLACMADFRVGGPRARFGSTFVNVGLIPGDGGAFFLSRAIGFAAATDMVLTARIVEAEEAKQLGMCQRWAEAEELASTAQTLAAHLAERPPLALRLAKAALRKAWESSLDASLEHAATLQGIVQNSADHDEAVSAFLEKRKPEFKGR